MKKFIILSTFVITLCFAGVSFGQDLLTNDEVISLSKAGLSSSIIIDKIRNSKSNFDLTTDGLIKLKQAGIPDDIVSAMMMAKHGGTTTGPANSGAPAYTPGKAAGDPNDPRRLILTVFIFLKKETAGAK